MACRYASSGAVKRGVALSLVTTKSTSWELMSSGSGCEFAGTRRLRILVSSDTGCRLHDGRLR